jgi:hypothetical protein
VKRPRTRRVRKGGGRPALPPARRVVLRRTRRGDPTIDRNWRRGLSIRAEMAVNKFFAAIGISIALMAPATAAEIKFIGSDIISVSAASSPAITSQFHA